MTKILNKFNGLPQHFSLLQQNLASVLSQTNEKSVLRNAFMINKPPYENEYHSNTLSLKLNLEDINLYITENNSLSYSVRKNNGFRKNEDPVLYPIKEEVKFIKLKDGTELTLDEISVFYELSSSIFNKYQKLVRLSQGSSKNELYRGAQGYSDFIQAGAGNDQFRLQKLDEEGDFFDGGEGLDTVYLQGNPADYEFKYVDGDANSENAIIVTYKDKKKKGKLIFRDIERVRFSGNVGKKGYISISDLMKNAS